MHYLLKFPICTYIYYNTYMNILFYSIYILFIIVWKKVFLFSIMSICYFILPVILIPWYLLWLQDEKQTTFRFTPSLGALHFVSASYADVCQCIKMGLPALISIVK